MIGAKPNYVEKARQAWGDPLPDWVLALAEEADRVTAIKIAKRLGYSNAVISYVLSNKYPGDVEGVGEKVRGALLGATVMCPVFGEMARDYCLSQQKLDNRGSSSVAARRWRHCHGHGVEKCEHSRLEGKR